MKKSIGGDHGDENFSWGWSKICCFSFSALSPPPPQHLRKRAATRFDLSAPPPASTRQWYRPRTAPPDASIFYKFAPQTIWKMETMFYGLGPARVCELLWFISRVGAFNSRRAFTMQNQCQMITRSHWRDIPTRGVHSIATHDVILYSIFFNRTLCRICTTFVFLPQKKHISTMTFMVAKKETKDARVWHEWWIYYVCLVCFFINSLELHTSLECVVFFALWLVEYLTLLWMIMALFSFLIILNTCLQFLLKMYLI